MKTDTGKGSGPRERQYSKKSRLAYGESYERIFGKNCTGCGGKGYYYDVSKVDNKAVKTTCLLCSGTGKVRL
jgi:hypothetical protein